MSDLSLKREATPAGRLSPRVGSGSCSRIGGSRIQPEARSRGDRRGLTVIKALRIKLHIVRPRASSNFVTEA